MIPAALVTTVINEAPALIAAIKAIFVKQNPGVPPPTSEEVIAAFNAVCASSIAKDEAWLSNHPA